MATNTYTALKTTTVTGSPTASVTLSSIPSGYTDIVLVISGNNSTAEGGFRIQCNTDTGSNYSWTQMYGNGTNAASNRGANDTKMTLGRGGTAQSNSIIHFMNYSNTTTYKTVIGRGNAAGSIVQTSVGLWRGTPAAINQLVISNEGGNIAVGTTFTLYGIASADSFVKATGGIISEDSTYTYHVFGSSGTFTPKQALTADILVVAGGGAGGGGSSRGGGGGAGGLLYYAAQSLTATGYTCTVGAGGAGSVYSGTNSSSGANSSFGALTAATGGGRGGGTNGSGSPTGNSGGSGGGGGYANGLGGAATSGQGNAGGNADQTTQAGSGGGGGAGAAGTAGSGSNGGNGGNGSSAYSSWGIATSIGENVGGTYYFAGGGGGGHNGTGGVAGYGGATAGNTAATINAMANTGGGSGGCGGSGSSGKGGSGVVIIRYLKG